MPSVIDSLDGDEAKAVLLKLLDSNPGLQPQAESLVKESLEEVSEDDIAKGVVAELSMLDYDDLNSRAGRHADGYVEPSEAAWELLEEALEPFEDRMKRYLALGMEEPARQVCRGMVQGLYRLHGQEDKDILNWAPDFPAETAGGLIDDWTGAKPPFSPQFAKASMPGWEWLVKKVSHEHSTQTP